MWTPTSFGHTRALEGSFLNPGSKADRAYRDDAGSQEGRGKVPERVIVYHNCNLRLGKTRMLFVYSPDEVCYVLERVKS